MSDFPFSEEEAKVGGKRDKKFWRGLIFGLGGGVIVVLIILAVIFFTPLKNKFFGGSAVDKTKAKIKITIITAKNCENCFDINLVLNALAEANIQEIGRETVYLEDPVGQQLVKNYQIDKVPTLLLAGELDKDEQLKSFLPVLGEVKDGVFVLRQVIPPYIDVKTGQTMGKVNVTFLTDKSCAACYDVMVHQNALTGLGLTWREEKTVDVSSAEGKELVKKYKITKVPTILMTGDLTEYQSLQQIWSLYGEVAEDGAYVFTGLDSIGTYKDLSKNKVVEVKAEQPAAQPTQQ